MRLAITQISVNKYRLKLAKNSYRVKMIEQETFIQTKYSQDIGMEIWIEKYAKLIRKKENEKQMIKYKCPIKNVSEYIDFKIFLLDWMPYQGLIIK